MTAEDPLYRSWMSPGSYFNQMLNCGDWYNQWVENALTYLPRAVLEEYKEKLAILAMGHRDGCRVARMLCENREIIILSERVLPKAGADEGHPEVRYFIYVVLHEVAHAIRNHRSPLFDNLSEEENEAQEQEAEVLALTWFNQNIKALNNPHFPPLSREEVESVQAANRDKMERSYTGQK